MLTYMTYNTSRDEKAMLRVFMRLQVNIIDFEMPMYTTHTLKCVRLQVDITGFEMPMYTTHAVGCVRFMLIY